MKKLKVTIQGPLGSGTNYIFHKLEKCLADDKLHEISNIADDPVGNRIIITITRKCCAGWKKDERMRGWENTNGKNNK